MSNCTPSFNKRKNVHNKNYDWFPEGTSTYFPDVLKDIIEEYIESYMWYFRLKMKSNKEQEQEINETPKEELSFYVEEFLNDGNTDFIQGILDMSQIDIFNLFGFDTGFRVFNILYSVRNYINGLENIIKSDENITCDIFIM